MSKGKVKWFNDLKGYGFITPGDDSEDIYVHHSDIMEEGYKTLREGEFVEFDVSRTSQGLQARNVVKVA